MRALSPYATDVRADDSGLTFQWPARSAEGRYVGDSMPWSRVRDIDLGPGSSELRLVDGTRIFVASDFRAGVATVARRVGIATVRRAPVWSHLLEPFLDTEYEVFRERWETDLAEWGFSADEVRRVRKRVAKRMWAYTAMSWEWEGYDQADLILVTGMLRPLPTRMSWPRYERFRRWTDEIAERGPVLPATVGS